MEPIDVIIIVAAALFVVGVIVWSIIRKKQGKSVGCDCGSCNGNCDGCKSCHTGEEVKK